MELPLFVASILILFTLAIADDAPVATPQPPLPYQFDLLIHEYGDSIFRKK